MAEFKNITISIPIDVFERVDRLAPRKKWGSNDVRDFYTRILCKEWNQRTFLN